MYSRIGLDRRDSKRCGCLLTLIALFPYLVVLLSCCCPRFPPVDCKAGGVVLQVGVLRLVHPQDQVQRHIPVRPIEREERALLHTGVIVRASALPEVARCTVPGSTGYTVFFISFANLSHLLSFSLPVC